MSLAGAEVPIKKKRRVASTYNQGHRFGYVVCVARLSMKKKKRGSAVGWPGALTLYHFQADRSSAPSFFFFFLFQYCRSFFPHDCIADPFFFCKHSDNCVTEKEKRKKERKGVSFAVGWKKSVFVVWGTRLRVKKRLTFSGMRGVWTRAKIKKGDEGGFRDRQTRGRCVWVVRGRPPGRGRNGVRDGRASLRATGRCVAPVGDRRATSASMSDERAV